MKKLSDFEVQAAVALTLRLSTRHVQGILSFGLLDAKTLARLPKLWCPNPKGPCRQMANTRASKGFPHPYFGVQAILQRCLDPLGKLYRMQGA